MWAIRAAKDRKEEFYDPARKEYISKRNKTRLELWEEHIKDPIVALDKAPKCVEDQYWSWLEALWKQGSNGIRSGGVGSDATAVGRGPVAFSECVGQCASTTNLYAVERSREVRAVWRALLLPSGEGANGPQGAQSAGAPHPAAWRASPTLDAEEAGLCARQRGLQLLHRGWLSSPRVEGRM